MVSETSSSPKSLLRKFVVLSQTSYLKSAHAAIASLPNKTYIVKGARKEVDSNGKETWFDLEITAKTDNADVNKFNLMGHSMGGMIVQEMTKLSGNKINKLFA